MFATAAEEISDWAERCRIWAHGARTAEHRSLLQSLERVLNQAAFDAERNLDDGASRPPPIRSS